MTALVLCVFWGVVVLGVVGAIRNWGSKPVVKPETVEQERAQVEARAKHGSNWNGITTHRPASISEYMRSHETDEPYDGDDMGLIPRIRPPAA